MHNFNSSDQHQQALNQERREILQQIEDWFDIPMLILSIVWLALFVIELTYGLTPLLEAVSMTIWIVFIVDFLVEFLLAPDKRLYLQRNWLTVLSLVLPALRVFRIFKFLRVLQTTRTIRSLWLLRLLTQTNRGMRTLATSVRRRGFGYVVGLTALVTLIGAAGIYAFEQDVPNTGIPDYSTALWWTAMLMTTMGTDYSPKSPEGRVLCFFLALYAFAMFGYLTASIASFFIGQDAADPNSEVVGMEAMADLKAEIAALRAEIHTLNNQQQEQS